MSKWNDCYKSLLNQVDFKPKVGIVLGSGLGDFAETIQVVQTIEYGSIEGFPVSTISGHKGRYVFGYVDEVPVVIMQGRVHYYEGYSMEDVVLPIRLMGLMGVEYLILTNAAGGLDEDMKPGDLMLITDQISSFVPSPLIGKNDDSLGTRFPDMSNIYDKELQNLVRNVADANGISLREGVYVQFTGPNYESPAEVRMAKLIGGSAVGMSTACEAIAANHMGMKLIGISCISNLASGISETPLNHMEVKQAADRVAPVFQKLVKDVVTVLKSNL